MNKTAQANRKIWRPAALLLVALVALTNFYRAWTQSVTGDEAFTYNLFLDGPPARLFNSYDAAHHVFHTLLCKISILVFGLSEFTLRLPSLAGGLLYLATVYRLSRLLFGCGPLMMLSVALLTLNPFVLDHLSAARGYGLALALFLWSLYHVLRYVSAGQYSPGGPPDAGRIRKIACGLALSVASNLTLLPPAAALALLFLSILLLDGAGARNPARPAAAVDSFIVPGVTTACLIAGLPLLKARMEHFYVGAKTLGETARTLLAPSFFHHEVAWPGPHYLKVVQWMASACERALIPAALLLIAVAFLAAARRWTPRRDFGTLDRTDQFLFFAGGSMLIALGIAVLANKAAGVLYPIARTGLYLIPLFVLLLIALWKRIAGRPVLSRIAGVPLVTLAGLCILQFALQFQVSHYGQWRYDAGTKHIIGLIRRMHEARPGESARVGVSWPLEPGVNFYRARYKLGWMAQAARDGPKGAYDYYILLPPDTSLVDEMGLTVVYSDRLSEALLAVPSDRKPAP